MATAPNDPQAEQTYKNHVRAWTWYDWADHAYITTLASTFFPPYFVAIAAPAFLIAGAAATDEAATAMAKNTASDVFALTVSIALLVSAVIAPIIGTYADITGRRKRLLIIATGIGGLFSSMMFTLQTGSVALGLGLYFITQIALNVALGSNSSLLPHVARQDDMDRVSSLGYAMGYFGGGVLLLFNTALYLFSDKIGLDSGLAVRIAFLSVGIWWIIFMLPTARTVPEPPATPLAGGSGKAWRDSFTRLKHTFQSARHYEELFKMLIAFWLYSEGIGAIILLATAYGAALGLSTSVLIGTLLMTQFVAFPYALIYGRIPNPKSEWRSAFVFMLLWTGVTMPVLGLYANLQGNEAVGIGTAFMLIAADQILGAVLAVSIGRRLFQSLAERLDAKRAVILGLLIYTVIPIWGFFLKTQAEFFMIGWLVGTVQGGTQALSRSIYSSLAPRAKSGEFFGLYGLSEKFAGILGPLLYALVGGITQSPRASVLSISVFFALGIYTLSRVNVRDGMRIALSEEAVIEAAHAAD